MQSNSDNFSLKCITSVNTFFMGSWSPMLVSVFNVNQDAAANVIIMYGTFVKLEKVKVLAKSVRFNL